MHILVTGGAGFIGSHTCVELLNAGHQVTVVDNLSNSSVTAIVRIEEIAGRSFEFHPVDLLDRHALERVFDTGPFDAVIHFAGLKAVGESVAIPLRYYHNNVTGTLHLLECMRERGVRRLVFSSSATVYGQATRMPLTEQMPLSATNPYGRTKLFIEEICRDLCHAEKEWRVVLLRYFNPVGAHPSGKIGEDPRGIPNNLMPFVMQVAIGRRPYVSVFGNDYPTRDGSGVRDYIHVVDLALGHLSALDALDNLQGCRAINLGTGRGSSVFELIAAASRACGHEIPYKVVERRAGDVPESYADPSLAKQLLGWHAVRDLDAMCADSWRWTSQNPNGYDGPTTGESS